MSIAVIVRGVLGAGAGHQSLVLAAALSPTSLLSAAALAPVPYLYDTFGGIHHLYANKKAEQGYKSGRFTDGSVIAFDLLEAKAADNTVQEGVRTVLGVMHRDSRKYKDTGGWGFEGFKGESKTDRAVGKNATTACFQCHTAQKDHDYVFSTLRR